MTTNTVHVPILVRPIVESLVEPFQNLSSSDSPHWLVDCTFGGGGHTAAFLDAFSATAELKKHKVLAIDQDLSAVEKGKERFKNEIADGRLEIAHYRFGEAAELLQSRNVLGLMADLGFSSDQLGNADRGLSFQVSGPLDMRLDPSRGQSCLQYLKQVSERDLEKVLQEYGEERFSKRIASSIIYRRSQGQLPTTTQELAELIVRAVPPPARHGRIHAATRTFQALRIVVNEELSELECLLNHVIMEVEPGGRIAILSFHSLEDRMVKHRFKEKELFNPLTKKPVEADDEEVRKNSRARSAKLRIAEVKSSK